MTLFLLLAAIVVDVGYWWVNAKKAQIAADACALAAAQSIPTIDPTSGKADPMQGECRIEQGGVADAGPDYVFQNLPAQGPAHREPKWTGTVVEWPYEKRPGVFDTTMVEATVKMKVGTFFGRIVGLHGVDVTRRAVAEQSTGVNEVAIHAHTTNCDADAIVLNGLNMTIQGIVESNADFEVNGDNIRTGPATGFHNGGNCLIKTSGKNNSFGGQPSPAHDPTPNPWPFYVVPGEHPFGWPNNCTNVGQNIVFDKKNEVIPPGIYCATESFEVKNEGISGQITVFSPRISIGGKNTTFSPSPQAMAAGKPLLFMHLANGTGDQSDDDPEPTCEYNHKMELNAEGITWTGVLFSPCGHINVNGAKNAALEGMIVAQSVRVNGENFNIKKLPIAGTNKVLALVE